MRKHQVFERDVDLETTFAFPDPLTTHDILGKHLIIAPEYANWIVCDEDEYRAFQLFRQGKSVSEVEALLVPVVDKPMKVILRLLAQTLSRNFSKDSVIQEERVPHILLRLTDGCNLRCTTCCFSCTVPGKDECTIEQWKTFLAVARRYGVEVLTLSGGEPLLNRDCLEIARYANEIGFRILLLTNGTIIDRESAKVVGENCSQVRISIDGPDAQTNDSIRGNGSFEKAIFALRLLSAYPQCSLTIAMTPTPATMPAFGVRLRQFSEWVRAEVNSEISFEVTGALMEGRSIPKLSEAEQTAFLEAVTALCDDQLETDFTHKLAAINVVPNSRVLDCGFGGIIPVKANGDIALCNFIPGPLCNIKDIRGDGEEFFTQLIRTIRSIIDLNRVDNLRPCVDCDLRYFCGGGCRKNSRSASGGQSICECSEHRRNELRERLLRLNAYVIEPIID